LAAARTTVHRRRFTALIAGGLLRRSAVATSVLDAASAPPPIEPDVVARVIVGIAPAPGHPVIDRLVATPEWHAHMEDLVLRTLERPTREAQRGTFELDRGRCGP
jgi:hypothetical protein